MIGRWRELLCLLVFGLGSAALYAGPVNINTADAETLAFELTGVGPALAAAIIEDREMNGDFESPEALTRVSGIGERIVEMNRPNILISDS
jgi:competence protein ComEA